MPGKTSSIYWSEIKIKKDQELGDHGGFLLPLDL
jgi:hypothetical protein